MKKIEIIINNYNLSSDYNEDEILFLLIKKENRYYLSMNNIDNNFNILDYDNYKRLKRNSFNIEIKENDYLSLKEKLSYNDIDIISFLIKRFNKKENKILFKELNINYLIYHYYDNDRKILNQDYFQEFI